jgi:8-oxo-dGTP diphosphatase
LKPVCPLLTVDGILRDRAGKFLLIRRKNPPYQGLWALPGGFVDVGETVEAACAREMLEETGLKVRVERLVGVYSDPKRDPRGHTVGIAFACSNEAGAAVAGDDAADAAWLTLEEARPLAFDHEKILEDYLKCPTHPI